MDTRIKQGEHLREQLSKGKWVENLLPHLYLVSREADYNNEFENEEREAIVVTRPFCSDGTGKTWTTAGMKTMTKRGKLWGACDEFEDGKDHDDKDKQPKNKTDQTFALFLPTTRPCALVMNRCSGDGLPSHGWDWGRYLANEIWEKLFKDFVGSIVAM